MNYHHFFTESRTVYVIDVVFLSVIIANLTYNNENLHIDVDDRIWSYKRGFIQRLKKNSVRIYLIESIKAKCHDSCQKPSYPVLYLHTL